MRFPWDRWEGKDISVSRARGWHGQNCIDDKRFPHTSAAIKRGHYNLECCKNRLKIHRVEIITNSDCAIMGTAEGAKQARRRRDRAAELRKKILDQYDDMSDSVIQYQVAPKLHCAKVPLRKCSAARMSECPNATMYATCSLSLLQCHSSPGAIRRGATGN